LGLRANAPALTLYISAIRLHEIVKERRAITPDAALRLAHCFNALRLFLVEFAN
jgi:plasmid maintenance system antidote protein VapI